MTRFVYSFGAGKADGGAALKPLLGGKGANLAEMTNLGLPVPPGFTISTEACVHYFQHGRHPDGLESQVADALSALEAIRGRRFGDVADPLLVSVRSGARVSMPGMMDTVLNLGLNDETVKALGDNRFAWDSYRRFIQMYSNVVLGLGSHTFESALTDLKRARGVKDDTELTRDDLVQLVGTYKAAVQSQLQRSFPSDPHEQLWGAITAVFNSWNTPRAVEYRRLEGIPDDWGTAVNVQSMVYGNMGDDCATGVAFTRDPGTGEKVFYGEYLVNAQGEDVVAGIRTPLPIAGQTGDTFEKRMPALYRQLDDLRHRLEQHYQDMQDLEFTVESGELFMLQTRTGKRSAAAAIRIAAEMADEGLIDQRTAVSRVTPEQINAMLHRRIDPAAAADIERDGRVLVYGLGASPGAACGEVVFSAEDAVARAEAGAPVILLRQETSPEDIAGMAAAQGIVTMIGGATSHAAVVARGMGKPSIVGCSDLHIDEAAGQARVGDQVVRAGDELTIDGSNGRVILGSAPMIDPELDDTFHRLMGWADDIRRLGVRTNADTPHDSQVARDFGAEGIGLCRTEHMFFEPERIVAVRRMILAQGVEARRAALAQLLPMQQADFEGIFRVMKGLPVTIRLLDPPLHEFLPHTREELAPIAEQLEVDVDTLEERVVELKESNPMLGHRGCRLAISYPEIYEMQAEAIIAAACTLVKDEGFDLVPEIMIPLVGLAKELEILRAQVCAVADRVIAEAGVEMDYLVGTMIELPRAAITADEVAHHADFFSFGTNDLTQTTFGLSRDDAQKFMPDYARTGVMVDNPFATIDPAVGVLVQMACEKGRVTRADLKLGICGEHGGDPRSVYFCHEIGLDYVSCSPYRVPVARMAAAHAVLREVGV